MLSAVLASFVWCTALLQSHSGSCESAFGTECIVFTLTRLATAPLLLVVWFELSALREKLTNTQHTKRYIDIYTCCLRRHADRERELSGSLRDSGTEVR